MDTDGNAWDILTEMIEAGITGISPCEVHANMHADRLREAFPELFLNGGIAKGALTKGPSEIASEVNRRFRVAWREGRYTPSIDHGAPPNIPWQNLLEYARVYKTAAMSPLE
jgi:hypothetical protein